MRTARAFVPGLVALALPPLIAVLLLVGVVRPASAPMALLQPITVTSAAELQALFERLDYPWPPGGPVPPVAIRQLPPDLAEMPVAIRKDLFFRTLLPLVLAENRRILLARERLERLDLEALSSADADWFLGLADAYRLATATPDGATREELLLRVDCVPVALVLAQAANESGWGTSRFVREANNLFGVWTWDAAAGLAPLERSAGSRHLVRIYPDLQSSVRSYIHNLNVGHAYGPLRATRAAGRAQGQIPDPLLLVERLERYSERGREYVRELREMIVFNQLHRLEALQLAPVADLRHR